jgi:signal transduction histidine kinase
VLNVVGHELRTPVTTLAGLAAELKACHDDRQRAELTEAIARLSGRLDHLVEDLLLASSIATVVPVGERRPVDLVALARERWTGGPIDFRGEAVALARLESLRRVLDEVLGNAAVYGEPPIVVTASELDGRAILEVANGGSVVDEHELRLAVEPFYRGEHAVTAQPGLGLGLALARTLARADDGELSIRPGAAGGVVVRLDLPAA